MPRVRADDYDAKARAILDSAAALFARVGYPNAKMQDIAKACGASKSMLYHYFPAKDDLLYAMLEEHLRRVIDGLADAAAAAGNAKERFAALVQAYTQKSAQSRRRHVTAMNDVKFLPRSLQAPLIELERRVIELFASSLRELNPALPEHAYKPYTMLLLGMLNWTDYWLRPGGTMRPHDLYDRAARLFLKGFMAEKAA